MCFNFKYLLKTFWLQEDLKSTKVNRKIPVEFGSGSLKVEVACAYFLYWMGTQLCGEAGTRVGGRMHTYPRELSFTVGTPAQHESVETLRLPSCKSLCALTLSEALITYYEVPKTHGDTEQIWTLLSHPFLYDAESSSVTELFPALGF